MAPVSASKRLMWHSIQQFVVTPFGVGSFYAQSYHQNLRVFFDCNLHFLQVLLESFHTPLSFDGSQCSPIRSISMAPARVSSGTSSHRSSGTTRHCWRSRSLRICLRIVSSIRHLRVWYRSQSFDVRYCLQEKLPPRPFGSPIGCNHIELLANWNCSNGSLP